jgi:hypothetical protein
MKKIVMALALGILGTTGAIGVGCGKDACATYGDDLLAKYDECGIAATSGGSGSSATATCTEDDAKLLGCFSTCLPEVDCVCFKDPGGSTCEVDQKPYTKCMADCGSGA